MSVRHLEESNKWLLRAVAFGGWVGGNANWATLKGWDNNSNVQNNEGFNPGKEFKLVYRNDGSNNGINYGLIELYRDDVLLKTSAQTYSGSQTLTLYQRSEYQNNGLLPNFQQSQISAQSDTPRGSSATQISSDNAHSVLPSQVCFYECWCQGMKTRGGHHLLLMFCCCL